MTHSEIVSFIWGVADLIRDTFKRGKYQDVILPFTVLRRLDCVLAPTKKKVLETNAKFKGKLDKPDAQLRKASGFAFYNTSRYDFDSLLDDHTHLKANLRNYIKGRRHLSGARARGTTYPAFSIRGYRSSSRATFRTHHRRRDRPDRRTARVSCAVGR